MKTFVTDLSSLSKPRPRMKCLKLFLEDSEKWSVEMYMTKIKINIWIERLDKCATDRRCRGGRKAKQRRKMEAIPLLSVLRQKKNDR